jgi:putative ABC transport system permease protein
MGPIPRIALRNVLRNKRRTLLTVLTMAISIGFFIWMDCIMGGFDTGAVDSIARFSESSERIATTAYAERRLSAPLVDGIPDPAAAIAAAERVRGVTAVTPRTRFIGQVQGPLGDMPVLLAAIDPAKDPRVFTLKEAVEGAWLPASATDEPCIILGSDLASATGLGIGDYANVFATSRYGTQRGAEFKVIGLAVTPDPNINSGNAYISYADAEPFLDLEGLVTELYTAIKRPATLKGFLREGDRIAAELRKALPGMSVSSINETSADILAVSKTKRGFSYVLVAVLLFISGIGIVNTILMAVYARVREIGVLGAFGMKRREITSLFLAEGAMIGLVGSFLGVAFGFCLDLLAVYVGMDVASMAKGMDTGGIPVWGILYGEWNPGAMAFGFFFSFAMALIASWIPARKAGRMTITRALRFV